MNSGGGELKIETKSLNDIGFYCNNNKKNWKNDSEIALYVIKNTIIR